MPGIGMHRQIIFQRMIVTADIYGSVRIAAILTINHGEVAGGIASSILIGGVMVEIYATQVVVGIETVALVAACQTVIHLMTGSAALGQGHSTTHAEAAGLEAVAVLSLVAISIIAIMVGNAIADGGRRVAIDEIVAVVGIVPRTAANEDVALVAC